MSVHKATEHTSKTDDSEDTWYFAIGSMMLPMSYELRNFHPKESTAAELLDYRFGFFGPEGFAEAIPSVGDSLHGVLHRCTKQQMEALDKIEVGYIRRTGQARPYGKNLNGEKGGPVNATVYGRPHGTNKDEENRPPQERYLEILIAGAQHFGIDPDYIQFLKENDCQPRVLPADFQSIGDPPPGKRFTNCPVSTNGSACFCLNGKVFQMTFPPDNYHGHFYTNMLKNYGYHFEIGMSQLSYDPKYGYVKDIKNCTPEHSAYIEDKFYRFMKRCHELKYYVVLGAYDDSRE
jgi:AIG2-like family